MSLQQRLAVSALLAINEALIDDQRLTRTESDKLSEVIAAVKESFRPRLPVLILTDPDFESTLDRVAEAVGADA
jgi:hypothetical protein